MDSSELKILLQSIISVSEKIPLRAKLADCCVIQEVFKEEDLKVCKEQLKKAEDRCQRLSLEATKASAEAFSSRMQLDSKNKKIAELETRIQSLNFQYQVHVQLSKYNQELISKVELHETQLAELRTQLDAQLQLNKEKQELLLSQEVKIQELIFQAQEAQQLSKSNQELEVKVECLQTEISGLTLQAQQTETLRNEKDELALKVECLQTEISGLALQVQQTDALRNEKDELALQVERLETEISGLVLQAQESNAIASENKKPPSKDAPGPEDVDESFGLPETNEVIDRDVAELPVKVHNLQGQIDALGVQEDASKQLATEDSIVSAQASTACMEDHSTLAEENEKIKKENTDLLLEVNNLQGQIEALSRHDDAFKQLHIENSNLCAKIKLLEDMIVDFQLKSTAQLVKVADLQTRYDEATELVNTIQAQSQIGEDLIGMQGEEIAQLLKKVEVLSTAEACFQKDLEQAAHWKEEKQMMHEREILLNKKLEKAEAAQMAAKTIFEQAAALEQKTKPGMASTRASAESLLGAQQLEIEALFCEVTQLRKIQPLLKGVQTRLDDATRLNEILNAENTQLRDDVELLREQVKKLKLARAVKVASNSTPPQDETDTPSKVFTKRSTSAFVLGCSPPSSARHRVATSESSPPHNQEDASPLSSSEWKSKCKNLETALFQSTKMVQELTQRLSEKEGSIKITGIKTVRTSSPRGTSAKNIRQLYEGISSPECSPSAKLQHALPSNCPPAGPGEPVIAIETGSCYIRCELLSQDGSPLKRSYFPCVLFERNSALSPESALPSSEHLEIIGENAWRCALGLNSPGLSSGLDLVFPMDPTIETMKLDHIHKLWKYAFAEIGTKPNGARVVLTHKPADGQKETTAFLEVLFCSLHIEAVCLLNEAVASANAAGVASALIVDIGEFATCVTPVCNNCIVESATRKLEVGGRHLTKFLVQMLQAQGDNAFCQLDSQVQFEVARILKEEHAFVAKDFDRLTEEQEGASLKTFSPKLPNGQDMHILAGKELFTCPEILFQPHIFSESEHASGLAEVIVESIHACEDTEIQILLKKNIILTGGTCVLPGLSQRLHEEIKNLTGGAFDQTPSCLKVDAEISEQCPKRVPEVSSVIYGVRRLLNEPQNIKWIHSSGFLRGWEASKGKVQISG